MHIIVLPVPPKISVVIREYYADAGGFVMGGLRGMGQISVMHMAYCQKGQGIYVFVTLNNNVEGTEGLKKELVNYVRDEIGAIAVPDKIQFAEALPKTRSGKIMRRILRKIAENNIENMGDVSTLEDSTVIEALIHNRI